MPVAFSNSGAYLMSASVSGPATARTRTTFGVGAVFDVLLLAQPETIKATAGSSASIRVPIPDLTAKFLLLFTGRLPPAIGLTGQPQVLEIIALPPRLDSTDCGRPPLRRNRSTTRVAAPSATASGPRRPISMVTWLKG